jgi:BolA protein
MTDRVEKIRAALQTDLSPVLLEIVDDSGAHAGHADGRSGGGGHYYLTVVSSVFAGLTHVQRHQRVYQALGHLMQGDIHALSMKLHTPEEYSHQTKESRP